MKKTNKTTPIKITGTDRKYLAYKGNILALERINKVLNKLDQRISRLRLENPNEDPLAFVRSLYKRRTELQKQVLKFQERQKRKDSKSTIIDVDQHIAKAINYIIESEQLQLASAANSPIILGESGDCQIVHDIIDRSSDVLFFDGRWLKDDTSSSSMLDPSGTFDIMGVSHEDILVSCEGSRTDYRH